MEETTEVVPPCQIATTTTHTRGPRSHHIIVGGTSQETIPGGESNPISGPFSGRTIWNAQKGGYRGGGAGYRFRYRGWNIGDASGTSEDMAQRSHTGEGTGQDQVGSIGEYGATVIPGGYCTGVTCLD